MADGDGFHNARQRFGDGYVLLSQPKRYRPDNDERTFWCTWLGCAVSLLRMAGNDLDGGLGLVAVRVLDPGGVGLPKWAEVPVQYPAGCETWVPQETIEPFTADDEAVQASDHARNMAWINDLMTTNLEILNAHLAQEEERDTTVRDFMILIGIAAVIVLIGTAFVQRGWNAAINDCHRAGGHLYRDGHIGLCLDADRRVIENWH